jgi:hypothetical protein
MDKKISSFKEFVGIITEEYSNIEGNSFLEKDKMFFRGQSDIDKKLNPAIDRNYSKKDNKDQRKISQFENKLIKKAMLSNPETFFEEKYPVNMLAKMQHYGLPTRLLDITENALVGLYFACKRSKDEDEEKDGCVYCFKKEEKEIETAFSINVNLIASQYKYSDLSVLKLMDFWKSERYSYYIPENNRDMVSSKISILIERISKPIFFFPKMITEREKRQQADFIIYPYQIENNTLKSKLYYEDKMYDKRIIVDKGCKRNIIEKLELLGIKESFLFPEVEKNCRSIKGEILKRVSLK